MYHPAGHAHAAHTYLSSFLVPGQPTGESPNSVFTDLVADLTEAVTGPLAAELTKELGVTLDADAFVAPTSFVQMEINSSAPSPTVTKAFKIHISSIDYSMYTRQNPKFIHPHFPLPPLSRSLRAVAHAGVCSFSLQSPLRSQ